MSSRSTRQKSGLCDRYKNIRHEYLLGDSLRLNQVLLNLLSNAGKFTPENGTITLTVKELPRKHSGHAVYQIAVADTGIGISPEFLPKLFLPFEREKAGTRTRRRGPDWGLSSLKILYR